jgi:[ribosomal protein S5]-alanine N-acetyltransferase
MLLQRGWGTPPVPCALWPEAGEAGAMLLFRRTPVIRQDLIVEAGHLLIRPPVVKDHAAWAALRAQSRHFLQPWEPSWPQDDLLESAFRKRIRRYASEIEKDESYPFFIFDRDTAALLGGLTLSNLRRGAASMATLGYWMGAPHAGKGHMTLAVKAILDIGFGHLGLRRIEAACVPENMASLRLLTKAGFEKEGFAREYLSINGQWRDHVLFAKRQQSHSGADKA